MLLKSILRLAAVFVVVAFEPTRALLFLSATLQGLGFWTGAVIPATIMDICDPRFETQFNHAYAWSSVPNGIGTALGLLGGGLFASVSVNRSL